LVTGGAAGIGEAVVRRFVAEGARTLLFDIDQARGESIEAELSGSCAFFHGNLTCEDDAREAVRVAEERLGPVTILVNNAARFLYRSVDATQAEWNEILGVNLVGASLITRFAVESMKRAGGGAIVNVSSISAMIAQSGTMTYNATKAALLAMTRCLALDLAGFNIRVNAVCPGYTETRSRSPEIHAALASRTLLKRLATPAEVANCVLFLASDEAAYVTGTHLLVDGGFTAI
jgi:dihydroanticapsin dehydrogenase